MQTYSNNDRPKSYKKISSKSWMEFAIQCPWKRLFKTLLPKMVSLWVCFHVVILLQFCRLFVNNMCVQNSRHPIDKGNPQLNASHSNYSASNQCHHQHFFEDKDCSYIELNATEYRILENGTLELLGTGVFYQVSQYCIEFKGRVKSIKEIKRCTNHQKQFWYHW